MERKLKLISASGPPVRTLNQIKEHKHIYYQLYYIREGNPVFVVDGTEIQTHPGSLFYIPPFTNHKITMPHNDVMRCYEFKVQIFDPFISSHLKKISPVITDSSFVGTVVTHIYNNWKYLDPQNVENIEAILTALFLGFFVDDLRYEQDLLCRISSDEYNLITRKIISYIGNDNFKREFSLQALSEKLNYNASYLSAVFTQNTGITIIDFLNLYRVRIATSLIVFYSTDIGAACDYAGFTNLSHFSRTFKKYTGSSPRSFKYVFSNMDRSFTEHLFINEPILSGGICSIEEALTSLKSVGAEVNRIIEQHRCNYGSSTDKN